MAAIGAASTFDRMYSLAGRTALITGASRGIGAAIARVLAEMGADIAINHREDAAAASDVASALRRLGRRSETFDFDVARADVATSFVTAVEDALGPIDILVINAAQSIHAKLEDASAADIDSQIEMNFKATIRLINAIVPHAAERGFGRIVTIGSIVAAAPLPDLPIYGAMKAAQEQLIRGLACRWASRGITFNNVSPGLIRTERNAWRRRPGGDWETFSRSASFAGRAGIPEEVACAVAMFCAPGASFITGETLYVAGGAQIAGRRT